MEAICAPGAVVADIARREDICTNLVYKWRREARMTPKKTEFASVAVEAVSPGAPTPHSGNAGEAGVIMVEVNEARVRICAQAPPTLVAATLKALRA